MSARTATIERITKETNLELALVLDGSGSIEVSTGIGFLDHMLTTLAFHAGWDLQLSGSGDLQVDDHHTCEDCALVLGAAIARAVGERRGIQRFGWAYAPLDEALARAVVDLCGRPWPEVDLGLKRETIGDLSSECLEHFVISLAMAMRGSLHLDVLRGRNDHHRAEAGIKALALALRQALATSGTPVVASTKGVLE
jgi:imidazoleglycerol phosphate dehydratase HisB